MLELVSQIAIVTGGESGIGAATVRALAERGCAVAINYLKHREAAVRVREDAMRAGARAMLLEGSVDDESVVARMFASCEGELGTPTILVNNAGINGKSVHVADMTLEQWEKTLSTNLRGAFLCAREFVRARRGKTGGGRIINISSIHEDVAVVGYADYDASKAGLLAFTRTLALETAPLAITVNAIAPGMILTPMNADAASDSDALEEKTAHIPLHRAGSPEEIAGVVAFLCSREAAYMTGASVRVDGGLSLNSGQGA